MYDYKKKELRLKEASNELSVITDKIRRVKLMLNQPDNITIIEYTMIKDKLDNAIKELNSAICGI